ncbi:MAG: hypothetical protein J0H62_04275, partial [Rhizobiales bacterium]|nr:hypothetical protein [Hyphomicrobiales bacterium]
TPANLVPVTRKNTAQGRIRLAYVSGDFRDHAVGYLAAGLFEQHDRDRFEVIAVSYGPDDGSALRARFEKAFDRFIDMRGKTDREIAELMAGMESDIAVDLTGYTQTSRPGILALRPAPVQVNFLGYPGTLGHPAIDYIIADRVLIPQSEEASYAEHVVTLPHSYQANDNRRALAPDVPPRSALGLPEHGFVFCCFNANYKITPDVFDVWIRLLSDVPGSVLWMLQPNDTAIGNLRAAASARGIAPERLVFAGRMPQAEHLARHMRADLLLDTLYYNAHTTASDALWAGLPIVTCRGSTFASRVGESLLRAVGLPELIAPTLEGYATLAHSLATDTAHLAAIREKLARQKMTEPLFDTGRFRRDIEAAYAEMHRRTTAGESPTRFAVEADGSVHG